MAVAIVICDKEIRVQEVQGEESGINFICPLSTMICLEK